MERRVKEEARRREVVVRRAAVADDGYNMMILEPWEESAGFEF